ncbi:MAG TPA: hypothetical protein PK649_09440, partial [Vicingus sp.]|nr:hypothetical protein [Vicingus sp.]
MARENKEIYSKSLTYHAWQRMKKNKLALFGMFIIGISTLIALLGPVIRPDSSPKANNQILEITTRKPGFSVDLLKIRKNEEDKSRSFWSLFSTGLESNYKYVPIYDYSFEGSNIVVEKYTGTEANNGQILRFNLADVVYQLDHNKVNETVDGLEFYTLNDGKKVVSIEELKKEVIENNIVTEKYLLGTDKYGRDLLSR